MLELRFSMSWVEDDEDMFVDGVSVDEMWDIIKNSGMSKSRPLSEQLVIDDYYVTDGKNEYGALAEKTFGPWITMEYAEELRENWTDAEKVWAAGKYLWNVWYDTTYNDCIFAYREDDFEYWVGELGCLVAEEK